MSQDWCDDDRKTSCVPRPRRTAAEEATTRTQDRIGVEACAFDLFKMIRELREEERDRMTCRPRDWPTEIYFNPEFEPCPPPGRRCDPREPPEDRRTRAGDDPKEEAVVREGLEDPSAEAAESATTLYGVAVADKNMRHAYT